MIADLLCQLLSEKLSSLQEHGGGALLVATPLAPSEDANGVALEVWTSAAIADVRQTLRDRSYRVEALLTPNGVGAIQTIQTKAE